MHIMHKNVFEPSQSLRKENELADDMFRASGKGIGLADVLRKDPVYLVKQTWLS